MCRVTQEAVLLPAAAAAGRGADLQEVVVVMILPAAFSSLEPLGLGAAAEAQQKTGC